MIRILAILTILVLLPSGMMAQPLGELVEVCAAAAGDDATYLKDFQVKLGESQPNQHPPVARYPLVLSSNNIYRFSICNPDGSGAKAVLKLYDSNKMIFSSYKSDSGEEFNPFNFMCRKTGIYHVFISFIDGKAGEAVGVLSYVNKK